jgi:hypothetical protein
MRWSVRGQWTAETTTVRARAWDAIRVLIEVCAHYASPEVAGLRSPAHQPNYVSWMMMVPAVATSMRATPRMREARAGGGGDRS